MHYINKKIFCTGNPQRKTIAYALDPDLSASLSSGWDFTDPSTLDRFNHAIENYTVFVNSSFIKPGIQETLMSACANKWLEKDIKGHIINIGTTLENTDDKGNYSESKRKLRTHSLSLSDQTGITGVKTTYVLLGGLGKNGCDPIDVAQLIKWIIDQPYRIPLIQIESTK